ncbi:hypothetical protein [uncultured Brevundimonas sp.]|uniref:hypothetical protein n=1 Tax=uncultured Brevundimonas sp. TaxID=213418 RepID=UPI00263991D7|nr:hypothetical protein [uncultured Brevundimonas sp.]
MMIYLMVCALQSIFPVEAVGPKIEGRGTAIDARSIQIGDAVVQLDRIELPSADAMCLASGQQTNCRVAGRLELDAALRYGPVQCRFVENAATRAHCVVWADDDHIYAPLHLDAMLIKQGLVRAAPDSEWLAAEDDAKVNKRGMWAFED